jgi:hypothetical protein
MSSDIDIVAHPKFRNIHPKEVISLISQSKIQFMVYTVDTESKQPKKEQTKPRILRECSVVMKPSDAKSFVKMCVKTISDYEKKYGEIKNFKDKSKSKTQGFYH